MNAGCYSNSRNVARYGCSTELSAHIHPISDHNTTEERTVYVPCVTTLPTNVGSIVTSSSQCLVLSASVADALRPGARLYLLRSRPAHQRPAQGRSDPPGGPGGLYPEREPIRVGGKRRASQFFAFGFVR